MSEISSPTTVDGCLLPMTKIMTEVGGIVLSYTEGLGGTRTASMLISMENTSLEEFRM